MDLLADQIKVIDCDSHVTEPPDLWTSRLGQEMAEHIPMVRRDEKNGFDRWYIGGQRLGGVAATTLAGWDGFPPYHPRTLEEADPAAWDPAARLKRLDEYGIHAQVLYPNLLGFNTYAFLAIPDAELRLQCVRAFNDFLTDFCAEDPDRLIPITNLPFWDLDASLKELQRCADEGHRGLLFAHATEKVGLPRLADSHWEPLWSLAEELGLPVNFHVGFADVLTEEEVRQAVPKNAPEQFAHNTSVSIFSNARGIAGVIMSGICHRHPDLNVVAVESGTGWIPFLLEFMDWNWLGAGAAKAHPERLLPSEYFRRQVYASYWFERESMSRVIDLFPDNVMFETDYPHAVSLSPGPASPSASPREMIERSMAGVDRAIAEKVLHSTAARLYGLGA